MSEAFLKNQRQKPLQDKEQQTKKSIWEAVQKLEKSNIDLEAFFVSTVAGSDYNYTKNYINGFKKS